MRILMLTDYFLPHIGGGVERVVYEISRRLAGQGHQVHIITLNTDRASALEFMGGFQVRRAKVVQLTNLLGAQSAFSFQVLPLALKLAKTQSFDIIHAHNLFFWTTAMALILKRRLRKPLVLTVHLGSLNSLSTIYRLPALLYQQSIGRLILRESDRVIAVSRAVADHGRKLGVATGKIRVIPNGVDLNAFKPNCHHLFTRKQLNIVFVGRLIFNKGPQYVVEAAPIVLREYPHVKFKFLGDGPMRASLEQKVHALKLESAFDFVGLTDNVKAILQDADVVVRPSLLEGMPLAVLEAMACGVPVVATAVGGTVELIEHNVNGLLVEPSNAADLAAGLLKILKDPAHARRMGQAGRELAEKCHSWDQITTQTVAVYEELI